TRPDAWTGLRPPVSGLRVSRLLPRPEPPLTSRVLIERSSEILHLEIRPQPLREHELRVRGLPEQVVRQAPLAARPDEDLGVVHLGRVEQLRELLLVASLEAPRGIDDLRTAAVVEGDIQRHPLVAGRLLLGP